MTLALWAKRYDILSQWCALVAAAELHFAGAAVLQMIPILMPGRHSQKSQSSGSAQGLQLYLELRSTEKIFGCARGPFFYFFLLRLVGSLEVS